MAKDILVRVDTAGLCVGLGIAQRSQGSGISHLFQGSHHAIVLPCAQKNGCGRTVSRDDDLLASLGGPDEPSQALMSLFHTDSCGQRTLPPYEVYTLVYTMVYLLINTLAEKHPEGQQESRAKTAGTRARNPRPAWKIGGGGGGNRTRVLSG